MRAAIVFGVITLTLGSFLLWQGKQEDRYCIEQWLANTQDLFQNATAIFSSGASSDSDQPSETEALDEKLQALLPVESTEQIDWHYKESETDITQADSKEGSLLPNLFDETKGAKTTVTGQLHLDEADNIVGAEVNVEIPTN